MTDESPITTTQEDRVSVAVKQRFQSGDLDALGEIYNTYAGPVHTVVRTILGPGGQTDDAVQEAFMRAWRGAPSFDPHRALGPWLFTIARRTAIDLARREGRPNRSNHDELTDSHSVEAAGIEEAWERWEIRIALDQLPEEERAVMMLSHYQGLTHPQIAERLGVPAGTVKSRSYRGHQRLAGLLSHLAVGGAEESR
jgi:RNA polymerase sigma-70 factor (ECF subfamily)